MHNLMRFWVFNRLLPFLTFMPIVFCLVGYGLSLVIPMTIPIWNILFIVSMIACLIIVIRFNVQFVDIEPHTAKPSLHSVFLITLPLLILIPAMVAILVNNTVHNITHGDFHTSILNQIIRGTFPPVNPQVPDYPLGYYWLYHALLAVPTHLLSIASPLVSAVVSLIMFIGTLLWGWIIVEELGFSRKSYLVMSSMIMIILFSDNLFGVFHAWDLVHSDGFLFTSRRSMVLAGDGRLYGLWAKYINFNSVSISTYYFIAGLFATIRLGRGEITLGNLFLLSFSLIGSTIFLFTDGLFLGLTLLPALGVIYIISYFQRIKRRSLSQKVSTIMSDIEVIVTKYTITQWLVSMLILAILFGLTVIHGIRALSSFPGSTTFTISSPRNLMSILSVNYPLIPYLIIGLWLAFRRDYISILLNVAIVIGFLISYVLILTDNNQYKFVLLNSIFVGLLVCRSLYWMMFETRSKAVRLAGYGSLLMITTLIWVNISLISAEFVRIALNNNQSFEYDGRYIMGINSNYRDTFEWIRTNTPDDTLVIQPLDMEALYTAMYTERLPYVGVYQFEISKYIPEYDKRVAAIDLFFNPASTLNQRLEAVQKFRSLESDRSLILAVPEDLDIPQEQISKLGFSLAYEGETATLYWLRQDGEFAPMTYIINNPQPTTVFTFGEDKTISIEGIYVEPDEIIQPCEPFWVSTWWQITQLQSINYLMKMVLVNEGTGQPISTSDASPGATPMTQWQLNESYFDIRYVGVPCDIDPGTYLLLIGMYEIDYDSLEFVEDLPVYYQGAPVGNLGFIKSLRVE